MSNESFANKTSFSSICSLSLNTRKIRNLAFCLHRYIGLAVGLILVIVGLTGSLLVFQKESITGLTMYRLRRRQPMTKSRY
ncbi:MAG: PepSY domain-containing protein [Pleurocapsa sp.]